VYLPEAHRINGVAADNDHGAVLAGAGMVAWSVASDAVGNCGGGSNLGECGAADERCGSNGGRSMVRSRATKGHRLAFNGRKHRRVMFPPFVILMIAKIGGEAAAVAEVSPLPLVIVLFRFVYLDHVNPKELGSGAEGLLMRQASHRPHTHYTRESRQRLIK